MFCNSTSGGRSLRCQCFVKTLSFYSLLHSPIGEKVGFGKVCLWCNEKGKSFYSTEAVQAHMTDKSHCKLHTDGDAALEFADFYDFRYDLVLLHSLL